MKAGLIGRDDRNIDERTAAFDTEVEGAERHDRVIALLLGLREGLMEIGRRLLHLRRQQFVEGGERHREDV